MNISLVLNILGLALALLTLPLVLELALLTGASLLPARRKEQSPVASAQYPLCVLIPAHNEETLIARCVKSILASRAPDVEIMVIAHNCTDRTAQEAKAAGAQVLELNEEDEKGKGGALRFGFAEALKGPAQGVLVIDADSEVDPNLPAVVAQGFRNGSRALQCRYAVLNSEDTQRTRLMTMAFHAINVIRPRGRARLGLSAGVFGNGFAIRRDVLEQIPYGAFSIVEDLEYHLNLVGQGVRVDFVDNATVRGEIPVSENGSRTQRARWEGGKLRAMRVWAPRLLWAVLRGRLRLVEPMLDLIGLPLAWGAALLLAAAFVPLTWVRIYVAVSAVVLIAHVLVAAAEGPDFWRTMSTLVAVPGYILWKVRMAPDILRRARRDAAWTRTERGPSLPAQKEPMPVKRGIAS